MPNHVHLIVVPGEESVLNRAVGEAHRRYTRYINFREKWRGYLWQGRFASFPMDEPYLLAAARYVERNPVKAGGRNGMGLSLEQCPCASIREKRRCCDSGTVAGPGGWLEGIYRRQQCG